MMTLIMSSVLVGKIATVTSTAAAGTEKLKKKKWGSARQILYNVKDLFCGVFLAFPQFFFLFIIIIDRSQMLYSSRIANSEF